MIPKYFNLMKLYDKEVLFTKERIDRNDIPRNFFIYEVKYYTGISGKKMICKIDNIISDNFYGTVISPYQFKSNKLNKKDYKIIKGDITLKDYYHRIILDRNISSRYILSYRYLGLGSLPKKNEDLYSFYSMEKICKLANETGITILEFDGKYNRNICYVSYVASNYMSKCLFIKFIKDKLKSLVIIDDYQLI